MDIQASASLSNLGKSVSRAQKMLFFGTLIMYGSMLIGLCFQYYVRDMREEEGRFCQVHQIFTLMMFASIPLSHLCFRWLKINYIRLWEECYGSIFIKEKKKSVLDLFVSFDPSRDAKYISNYKTADCGFYLLVAMNGLFMYSTYRRCE